MKTQIFAPALIFSAALVEGQLRPDGTRPLGYFNDSDWTDKTADEKITELWEECQNDQTVVPVPYSDFKNLFTQPPGASFGRSGDELPRNRPKINHAQGVVGLVDWVDLGNHSYTGLYDNGSDSSALRGLIRLSEGNFILPNAIGLTPSLAIKFPRTGMRSVNHLANVSFDPVEGWNFFAHDFRSRVDMFEGDCAVQTIERVFLSVTSQYQSLGLSEFASYETDGTHVTDVNDGDDAVQVNFPYELTFEPNPDVAELLDELMSNDPAMPWYEQLKAIEEETILFRVMAKSHPNDASIRGCLFEDSVTQHIADIRLKSQLITSTFGDSRLFFQHENMMQDNELRPQWRRCTDRLPMTQPPSFSNIEAWPQDDETAANWLNYSIGDSIGCPFAWLMPNWLAPSDN